MNVGIMKEAVRERATVCAYCLHEFTENQRQVRCPTCGELFHTVHYRRHRWEWPCPPDVEAMFTTFIQQVCRSQCVLKMPMGNVLLVGVSDSGWKNRLRLGEDRRLLAPFPQGLPHVTYKRCPVAQYAGRCRICKEDYEAKFLWICCWCGRGPFCVPRMCASAHVRRHHQDSADCGLQEVNAPDSSKSIGRCPKERRRGRTCSGGCCPDRHCRFRCMCSCWFSRFDGQRRQAPWLVTYDAVGIVVWASSVGAASCNSPCFCACHHSCGAPP